MISAAPRHVLIDGLNLQVGGGVTVMMRLAAAFARAGHRVTVVLAHDLAHLDDAEGRVSYLVKPELRGALKSLVYRFTSMDALLRDLGADAILTFNYHTPIRLPQITYHINVIPFLSFYQRRKAVGLMRAVLQGALARRALRRSHLNLFESRHVHELAKTTGIRINHPDIAYIGVDAPKGQASALPKVRSAGPIVTITSGATHKRNDLTLAFFRRHLATDPTARLVIIGDAEMIRASLGLEDRQFADTSSAVSFSGYLDRAALFAQLAQASALVTFSELESFFMVAVEAMAVGCPIIAPDISSIRESTGNGDWVFNPGDVDRALAMMHDLRDPDRWAVASTRAKAWAARFDAEACARKFVDRTLVALEAL